MMRGFILTSAASIAVICAAPAFAQAQAEDPANPPPTAPAPDPAATAPDPATTAATQAQTTDAAVPRGARTQATEDTQNKNYPRCSKTVKDNCKQRGA